MTLLERLKALHPQSIDLSLGRIERLLAALAHPERKLPPVVHVAGTNGKGSLIAFVRAIAQALGKRVHVYTSPHLVNFHERIVLAGAAGSAPITEDRLVDCLARAEAANSGELITLFEITTAAAFLAFSETPADLLLLETGLGGRLDATNVVERPLATSITPISIDHVSFLGNTLAAIAGEKAGILKPGVPCIFARQRPEADAVLRAHASDLSIPVIHAADFKIENLEMDARGSRFSGLICPLAGEHQVDNAVTAALALRALGAPPQGIVEARWPGRLEHVSPNPDIILDGAHNPAGARALAGYLSRFYSGRRIWLVYGAMRDKAIEEIAGILFPLAEELIFTAPASDRALRPEALLDLAGRGHTAPDIAAALDLVRHRAAEEDLSDDVVVITGSLFLVGEARALFTRRGCTIGPLIPAA